ncbi:MAG: HNH endonuclease [Kibdelosporangium sp.]
MSEPLAQRMQVSPEREALAEKSVAPGVTRQTEVLRLSAAAGNGAVSRLLAQREPDASMPPPNQTADPRMSVNVGPAPTNSDLQNRKSTPPEGAFSGKKIGTWGRWIDTDLKAGTRDARNCQTPEEATAVARGMARASVVIQEKVALEGSPQDAVDAYVVYPIVENTWFNSLSAEGTKLFGGGNVASIKPEGGVPLHSIVTTDGTVIRPMMVDGKPDPKQHMLQQSGPAAGQNPFDGFREAFGAGMAGLDGADKAKVKEQFLRVFELALKDTAMSMLNTSAAEAGKKAGELETGIPDADWEKIEKELPELIRLNDKLRELSVTLESGEWMPRGPGGELHPSVVKAGKEHDETMIKRSELFQRYPLLSQIDPVEFKALPREERRKRLQGASKDVVANIETTRKNIEGGAIEVWLLGPLVQATLTGLGIADQDKRAWALEKAKWEHTKDDALGIAFGVLMVGLGLAAMVFTGGAAGVALAAGMLTLGVADAAAQTANYFKDRAAANTDVNKEESLIPKDLEGQWVWVAVAWISVGLDAHGVIDACRAAQKAGLTLEKAAEQFAEQVKRTPGDLINAAKRFIAPLTEETARATLLQALPAKLLEQHPHLRNVPVKVLKSAEFEARFGSTAGEAVTQVRKGAKGELSAEVFVKETATPRGIADEAIHLEQSVDPEMAGKMGKVADLSPEAWAKLKLSEQLPQFEAKLEVEIDAARRSMAETTDLDDLADLKGTIDDLEKYLADVRAAMKETDPEAMLKRLPWWDPARPPWLFAKARLPKTNGRWSNPAKPGNSLWYSDHPDVRRIVGDKGIPFRGNYPVFQDWAEATVKCDFSQADHFAQADRAWAAQLERRGMKSKYPEFFKANGEVNAAAVERWRQQYGYTWHHHQGEGNLMLLLPRDLHANVPHTGGHAISRGSHTP